MATKFEKTKIYAKAAADSYASGMIWGGIVSAFIVIPIAVGAYKKEKSRQEAASQPSTSQQ